MCLEQHAYTADRGRELLREQGAFRAVTEDCAYKYLMSVQGQPKHGASGAGRDGAPGIHAVFTFRSLSGCMFRCGPVSSEHPPLIIPYLTAIPGVFEQMEILGLDRPADWDVPLTYMAAPALKCIYVDPIHLVFAAANYYGNSMKPGIVSCLRKVA